MKRFSILITAMACLVAGCAAPAREAPAPAYRATESRLVESDLVAFPRLANRPDGAEMQALAHGRLELEEGCLRLVMREDSRLIVWSFAATPFPDGRGVTDRSTGNAIRVGEEIVIGGGEVSALNEAALEDKVPSRCRGPYWIAGKGFFTAPDPSWRTARLASPVTVSLPTDMVQTPVQPIDSIVDRFEGPTLKLIFDYGRYGCGVSGGGDAGGHALSSTYVDQRPLHIDRYAEPSEDGRSRIYRLDARMPGLDGPRRAAPSPTSNTCLAVFAQCLTSRDCDTARSILSTIRIGPATRDEALSIALAEFPELGIYRTASLPPHSIEAERERTGGWLLGFIRSGSGLPGIIDARCLRVTRFGEVEEIGAFRRSGRAAVQRLDLASCRAAA